MERFVVNLRQHGQRPFHRVHIKYATSLAQTSAENGQAHVVWRRVVYLLEVL